MDLRKILKIMKAKNLNTKQLSELSGVPISTVNRIVYGLTKDPSVNAVRSIAHALGYTLDELLEFEDDGPQGYYLDSDSARIAQEIYENPDLKLLFDTTRKVDPEDLKLIAKMVSKMVKDENGEEE